MNQKRGLHIILLFCFISEIFGQGNGFGSTICGSLDNCGSCSQKSGCNWCVVKDPANLTNGTRELCIEGTSTGPVLKDLCKDFYWLQCTIRGEALQTNYTYIIVAVLAAFFSALFIVVIILIISLVVYNQKKSARENKGRKITISKKEKIEMKTKQEKEKDQSEYATARKKLLEQCIDGSVRMGSVVVVTPDGPTSSTTQNKPSVMDIYGTGNSSTRSLLPSIDEKDLEEGRPDDHSPGTPPLQGGPSVEIDVVPIPPAEPSGDIYRPPTPTDPQTPRESTRTSNRKSSRSRGDSMSPPLDVAPSQPQNSSAKDPEDEMIELQRQMDELLEINSRNRKKKQDDADEE